MVAVRVVSWNVRSLRDDVGAVARVLRGLRPDLVCLQEAPRFLRWRHRLRDLGRRADLAHACGGRSTGGPALLVGTRLDVRTTYAWRLSRTPRQFVRGVAAAAVRVDGADLFVASTHLGLTAAERERHAGELLRSLARVPVGSAVLAGDLNETDAGPAWRTLTERRFRDAYALAPVGAGATFPSRAARRRIDAVLVDEGISVRRCGVAPDVDGDLLRRASDHLPIVADLELGTAPAARGHRV